MNEQINHPSHYCQHPSKIECIEIAKHHDFCIGNAIKYIWRCGLKSNESEAKDLKKAIWYLTEKLKMIENEK